MPLATSTETTAGKKTQLLRMGRLALALALGVAMSTTAAATGGAPRANTKVAGPPRTCHGNHGNLRFRVVGEESPRTIRGLDVPGYLEAVGRRKLYVPSSGSSEILVLDANGDVIRRWGEPGTGPGQFGFLRDPADPDSALGGVAVGRGGAVYVAEAANRRIQRFTAAGVSDLIWGSTGIGPGQFLDPIGVALGPSGDVYVVDDERDDIQVFTPNGTYLRTIGRHGSGPGELSFTGNIRVRHNGDVVNADFDNGRVQAWNSKGRFLWTFGMQGTGPGQFNQPQDVAFDRDGNLYVVDDARVQAFDKHRRLIGTWPNRPSPHHFGSIALVGDELWVEAPYIDTFYRVRVSHC